MIYKGHLFKKVNKNISLRRVMDLKVNQARILEVTHEESGHKRKEETYRRMTDKY
jgi:hypothetical protein